MLQIRPYQETDREAWDSFVRQHPSGTIFHMLQWKRVIEKTFGHTSCYLIAEDRADMHHQHPANKDSRSDAARGGSIVGVLPLFEVRSLLFGKYLISVPFAELGGPIGNTASVEQKLIDQAILYAKDKGLDYLELRNRESKGDNLQEKELYFNFQREIFPDLDDNMNAIPRKARRMIRQGEKNLLSFEFGAHNLETFYDLLARNYHYLGTPIFTPRLFSNFSAEFGEDCNVLIVFNESRQPIAGVLFFLYLDQVLPYYAGSLPEYRTLAPNDYMYWQLMRFGCEKGYKTFDFGRSKDNTGSFDFKRHWGFEPTPLHYQYYLNTIGELPNLSPANPKYRRKIEIWRRLPFGVTKVLGPLIAKYLA